MLIRPSRAEQKMPRVEIVPRNYNEAFRGPPFVRNLESDEKKSFWPPTLAQNLKPNPPTHWARAERKALSPFEVGPTSLRYFLKINLWKGPAFVTRRFMEPSPAGGEPPRPPTPGGSFHPSFERAFCGGFAGPASLRRRRHMKEARPFVRRTFEVESKVFEWRTGRRDDSYGLLTEPVSGGRHNAVRARSISEITVFVLWLLHSFCNNYL